MLLDSSITDDSRLEFDVTTSGGTATVKVTLVGKVAETDKKYFAATDAAASSTGSLEMGACFRTTSTWADGRCVIFWNAGLAAAGKANVIAGPPKNTSTF